MPGPLVCDIASTELTDHEVARIRSPLVGMVILFTRNYKNPAQLKKLCDSIHAVKPDVLIGVDHEGGRVQRFREGFTEIPSMHTYGELWKADPEAAARSLTAAGYVMASELRACGVDFTFAPVLDLDWGKCEVIGERAFSLDPRVVTRLARALSQGMLIAGMANCGKHFPGHGFVSADSHKEQPVDDREADRILHADAKPYSWMGAGLCSVMTAHILYPALDSVPATYSEKILKGILRDELRFTGLVFSDDLSMKGAGTGGDILERAKAALKAGGDALIVCNSPEEADTLTAKLEWRPTADFRERWQRIVPRGMAPARDELKCTALYKVALQQMMP